jgi:hypothetical protein
MAYPNTFHNSRWKVTFSNLPTISNPDNLKYIEHYVKSIAIPDYNITEYFSDFKGTHIRHPVSHINDNLTQIQLDLKVSENLENYLYLFEWMQRLRYGEDINNEMIRRETINRITLHMLDNQSRSKAKVHFTEAFLLNLSSIALDSGVDDEIITTCNFSYEEVLFERESVFHC